MEALRADFLFGGFVINIPAGGGGYISCKLWSSCGQIVVNKDKKVAKNVQKSEKIKKAVFSTIDKCSKCLCNIM